MTMINTLLGSKQSLSQAFVHDRRLPVTRVTVGPCVVTQIKTLARDGYWAIQLGFGNRKAKNTSKSLQGHLNKNQNYPRFLKEVRMEEEPTFKVGDVIRAVDIFKVGDIISVTGKSKGKGFAGGVKRHHFKGGPRTHGQSDRERAPGSIGQTTTPGRVFKGKRMAGRMGNETVTVKGLRVVSVDAETNTIEVAGLIPGPRNSLLILKKIKAGSLKNVRPELITAEVNKKTEEVKSEDVKESN